MNLQDKLHQAHKARQRRFVMAGINYANKYHCNDLQKPSKVNAVYMKEAHNYPEFTKVAQEFIKFNEYRREVILRLSPRQPNGALRHHTIENIKKRVAKIWRVSIADMESKRRDAKATMPRHIAMWLCQKYTRQSLPTIGRHFGGRDHTTVLSACIKIEARKRLGLQAGDKEKSPVVLVAPVIVGSMEFPTKKAAVHYFLGKNMSAMEIASLIGSTENSVRSIISRNKKDPKFSGVQVDL